MNGFWALAARDWPGGWPAHELVRSMVKNNIRKAGPVVLTEYARGEAIRKAAAMSPAEVIRAEKTARLRGRGGAGFPTGIKWDIARAAPGLIGSSAWAQRCACTAVPRRAARTDVARKLVRVGRTQCAPSG